ncbi:hypothetical protein PBAL39_16626 [Pedobacter sp. BAL39]|nr:hypothetical protein PBAL39_16626 [Pedobacter sp. BAL39]
MFGMLKNKMINRKCLDFETQGMLLNP